MIRLNRHALGAASSLLALAAASAVYAQETTAAVRGRVVDSAGAPIAGATVTVTHAPTGSAATAVTGADGFYSMRGLRVGGPYEVKATANAYETNGVTIDSVGVGDPAVVDVTLSATGAVVAEVVVSGRRATRGAGPSTNFTASDIERLPSISRDLKDFARQDPFAAIDPTNQDALSFGGTNTRFNQLTVDGVRQNDDFGLNNNGYPTQRSPISIDAVQAVNVSSAPYSVINNGFTGGQINAVTKSGGNKFSGSAFYEETGDNMQGNKAGNLRVTTPFSEKSYGATLGGPIIKDRAFFFLSYDKFEGLLGLDTGPTGAGLPIEIPRITVDAVNTFIADTKRIYGYDPGSYLTSDFPVSDEKWLGKIDINLTDKHRATFTYQKTLGNSLNGSVSSVFASGNSTTQPAVGLESRDYNKVEFLETYTAQLNSQWTDSFSTELRYSQKETDTQQNPLKGLSVGQTRVMVPDLPGVAAGAGSPRIEFGADVSRHDNYLNVKLATYEAIGRYHWGSHDFLFGARTEKDEILDVFVANSIGSYTFNTYADYLAKRAATFTLTGGVDPNAGTAPATLGTARLGQAVFDYRLSSVYAEDHVQLPHGLDFSFGARYDWYDMSDAPPLNANFVSRNGFTNQANMDGKHVFLPRVSANWRTPINGLRVSGGIGRFSSLGVNVWITNPFSNTGVTQTNAVCPAGPYNNVDLTKAPAGCTFTPGNGDVNAIDPAFKIPTVWKETLSVSYRFDLGKWGNNWLAQVDYLAQQNEDALFWYDLRLVPIGTAPDGRPVFGQSTKGNVTGNTADYLLTNNQEGSQHSTAFTLGKTWLDGIWAGLDVKAIYTNTHAKDANPMNSSTTTSSYTKLGVSNPNGPLAARSDYEIRSRYLLNVNYTRKFWGDNETSVAIIAQRRTGLPFSYTFANSSTSFSGVFLDNDFGYPISTFSGRQASSNALLYVPKVDSSGNVTANSDASVRYAAGTSAADFNDFLHRSGLIRYAGQIAPRNYGNNPDVNTVDMRLSQEFSVPGHTNLGKVQLYMDIENLGNLINKNWGQLEQYDFSRLVPVINVSCNGAAVGTPASCAAPGAVYTYTGTGTGNAFVDPVKPFKVTAQSLWQMKLGVRYKF